ncbi:MAG: hypothetical protein HC936_15705 [Leptolyngbyaceae cyanobacterium SU_3_3]|nr:hypothetical protein [Leptolyngbyaceae cyanobacterium SU_3_3]
MPETEFWEFLLQKEGDRSWLPLESPDVEILEGRYRIVARSHRQNSNVEVRITHHSTGEVPPKRRTQKRSHRTNAEGLVVVIPFTSLKPGTWELDCSGDLMSDLMGNGWQASIQLHVAPRDVEDSDDWEPDWELRSDESPIDEFSTVPPSEVASPEDLTSETASEENSLPAPTNEVPVTGSSVDRLLKIAEQLSDQMTGKAQDLEVQDVAREMAASERSHGERAIAPLPPLHLSLTQETFVAHRGQVLTVTGEISPIAPSGESALTLPPPELKVSLRDPQSAEVLLETCELILGQPLPMQLAFEIALPPEFKPRLLLGELALYDLTDSGLMGTGAVLAHQSFTLTADAAELLESSLPIGAIAKKP